MRAARQCLLACRDDEERQKHREMYAQQKKKSREDRLTWLNSDDMPYK